MDDWNWNYGGIQLLVKGIVKEDWRQDYWWRDFKKLKKKNQALGSSYEDFSLSPLFISAYIYATLAQGEPSEMLNGSSPFEHCH